MVKKFNGVDKKELSEWQKQYIENNKGVIVRVWKENGKIKVQYTNGLTDTI